MPKQGQPCGPPFAIGGLELRLHRWGGYRESVRARTCKPIAAVAIGVAAGLTGARPFDSLHLARAADHLPAIGGFRYPATRRHGSGRLVRVENLVATIIRFQEEAPYFRVGASHFTALGIHALFTLSAANFSHRGAFPLIEHERMAIHVANWNTLQDRRLVALAAQSDLCLRRARRNCEQKYRTPA